jgi:hypothetical protein
VPVWFKVLLAGVEMLSASMSKWSLFAKVLSCSRDSAVVGGTSEILVLISSLS